MKKDVINRAEMIGATLDIGGEPVELADYATTGLLGVAVGPRGNGKTNAGLLIAEQLSKQGWVCVLIDPENELETMYGDAIQDSEALYESLKRRDQSIVVIRAADATQFIPFGRAILRAADEFRQPLFVMIDEGQVFSSARGRKEDLGEAADIVNEFAGRGRKRALDLFITALSYTGSLHRTLFRNKNLTLIGCQEDATAWASLAAQFRGSGIDFKDLNALAPGEFFCLSRRGVEKIRMPMAAALQKVAQSARPVRRALPTTFSQWDRAMREIPTRRLKKLNQSVIDLLSQLSGLSGLQVQSGMSALKQELEDREELADDR